jgi:hypothetical protein
MSGLFQKLWDAHPTGELPCSTDGKSNHENQCAIRMGVAFTKAGVSMKTWGIRSCWHHPVTDGHTLAAEEMANALANRAIVPGMGKVEKYRGEEWRKGLKGRRGIFFCKDFYGTPQVGDHIDLWNGWRLTSAHSVVSVYSSFGSNYGKGQVWFWALL